MINNFNISNLIPNFFRSKKVKEETGGKKEEIINTLNEEMPRARPIEEQKKTIDIRVASNPPTMPNTICKILTPRMYGESAPRKSALDSEFMLNTLDKLLKTKYFINSAQQESLRRLKYFLEEGEIPITNQESITQYIINTLSNNRESKDVVEILVFFKDNKFDPSVYEKYYSAIINIGKEKSYKQILSEDEDLKLYLSLLEEKKYVNGPNSEYQYILDVIITNEKLLKKYFDYQPDNRLKVLWDKGAVLDQERYQNIVNLCIDKFLQGETHNIDKQNIRIALWAVKKGFLDQAYYEKVIKAGLELLISK